MKNEKEASAGLLLFLLVLLIGFTMLAIFSLILIFAHSFWWLAVFAGSIILAYAAGLLGEKYTRGEQR